MVINGCFDGCQCLLIVMNCHTWLLFFIGGYLWAMNDYQLSLAIDADYCLIISRDSCLLVAVNGHESFLMAINFHYLLLNIAGAC